MKVASGNAAAAAGPSCALKAGKTAGEVVRCLSEQSVAISRCAGGPGARLPALLDEQQVNVLLYDMNGCYSRLKELVPTLPQNRKVSRVEILQHVIDYIWDLELELNSESHVGTPGGRGLPARAPLSTLNGEISALAAEVRSEVEHGTGLFRQMGKLSPGEEGAGGLDPTPTLSFRVPGYVGVPEDIGRSAPSRVSWGRAACSLVPSGPPVSPLLSWFHRRRVSRRTTASCVAEARAPAPPAPALQGREEWVLPGPPSACRSWGGAGRVKRSGLWAPCGSRPGLGDRRDRPTFPPHLAAARDLGELPPPCVSIF